MSKVSIIGVGEVGASCATCTKDILALILGGHGKSMVPMLRYTTIGGIPIRNQLSEDKVQEAIHRAQLGGEEIIAHLGRSGWYAAGVAVCDLMCRWY